MAYFAGLDVSVKETSVCIVDDAGKIVREARVASEPDALLQVLTIYRFKRVGLEAGPLSQWLYGVDLSRHRRRARSLPKIQGSRSRVWADVRQVSIGRGRSERQNITLRRRDDAGHALRSSSEHAAVEEMVLAQSLCDADLEAPRDEKGDRGPGTPVGCDHAPHMG